ncbi:MAG: ribonuclease HII [Cyclobacteriaceae bacterium]|jgi:ribonuclease HII
MLILIAGFFMLEPYYHNTLIEAGCDEAGRGCLAGPVVAGAVIFAKDFQHPLLDDSKKISRHTREQLVPIIEKEALSFAIGVVSAEEIDQINILNASFLAMQRAVDQLTVQPELLLIDGNRYRPAHDIPFECIIKGDGKFTSIAAASVLAKTFRDRLMTNLSATYSGYGWETNAGYPTKAHRSAIRENGVTPYHRMSFQLLPKQLDLFDQNSQPSDI